VIEDISGRVPAVATYPEFNYLHGEPEKALWWRRLFWGEIPFN
jgi:hypothetical protein